MSGKEVNLTGDNITIESNNFGVDTNGNVRCNYANIYGANISGGKIELEDVSRTGDEFSIYSDNYHTMIGSSMLSISEKGSENHVSIDLTEIGEPNLMISKQGGNYTSIKGGGITTPKLTQTSLQSKKKNIEKLNIDALKLVKEADICEYNFKDEEDNNKKHIGLVIGEGYNCPEQVIDEKGEGVEQYSLTSLLWKAVQELTDKVERLEAKLNEKD